MLENLFNRHLEEDEPLYMVVHKHWLIGIKEMLLPVAVFVGTLAVLYYVPFRLAAMIVTVADIGVCIWILRNFFDYYLDGWVITDRAIIDVEWHGWFHRESTRIDYSSIEGVSYEIKGIFGTLLRYGTVSIEKISSGSTVSIEHVKNPRDIESIILACQEACIRSKNMKDSSTVKDIIAEIVAERMYLRDKDEEEEEEEVEVA
jgi:hypothetical protein